MKQSELKQTVETAEERKQKAKDAAREKLLSDVNQSIDDDRISITSPEIRLKKDTRPKTNLDVAIAEHENSIRFLDFFKYVFNRVTYAVFLGIIVLAVATVLAIIKSWQEGLIAFGGGVLAVAVGFLLMWYVSRCLDLDRRAYLFRIKQETILFKSIRSDCYRELKTKYTVLKALSWLLNKLSVILSLVVILSGVIAAVIITFIYKTWLFSIILGSAIIVGILVYWLFKILADIITYKLDAERNQQISQQTLLDILSGKNKQ